MATCIVLQVADASAYQVGGCYRFYIDGTAAAEASYEQEASAACAVASFVGRVLTGRVLNRRTPHISRTTNEMRDRGPDQERINALRDRKSALVIG